MQNETSAAPDGTQPDFDHLLRSNLKRVFNERDDTKRMLAIRELFVDQPVMYEPDGIVRGREAISAVAGALLERFGPTFRFVPDGAAVGHHELGILRWHAGPEGGPIAVTGTDVAEIAGGAIVRLWVMLEQPST